ncbi:MAG: FixH family protein [Rhodoferax sp.]|nr:FixH family protein [Rhodoferax sp.]
MDAEDSTPPQAWWRFGHVWLIIAGPALVVIAGFVTLYLAVSSPNEIVTDEVYRHSVESNRKKGITTLADETAPAMQARNHAATGAVPLPK